ncbi:hypothetical protein ACFFJY_03730 [Fictibacillus aquaticus]|uniref:Uncharacterized protein n=1 Tax=Fictibacillus aquaticus TaxID=2021314 RepID=A0A235FED9_9BACL|nr:hypothetical protein [Fictibacillus aquaticus]OYD59718.1 hypothetical protein CGZ90_07510 [Fictibacillus aquaticus]
MKITFPIKFFAAMMLISTLIVFNDYFIPNPFPSWEKIEGFAAALFIYLILKLLNRKGYLDRSFPDALNVFFIVAGVAFPVIILVSYAF